MNTQRRFRFGQEPRFELQLEGRRLLSDGVDVALGSRAFDVLAVLVGRAPELVRRAELIEAVWPDSVVEENNLSVQINALRKVLGTEYIRTVPGRGYCFVAPLDGSDADATQPAAAAPQQARAPLPPTLIPVIGRETDLEQLQHLLADHRLVSIVGTAGVGKTLLSRHLLRRLAGGFKHGVCFIELAPQGPETAIEGLVASALGIELDGTDPRRALLEAVRPLQVLIALDNAEHLLEPVAELVAALHASAPRLKLVITSQAPLKLASEQVYRLGPLALPPRQATLEQALQHGALALFADRAQAADSRFRLEQHDLGALMALCHALEGLPLAIELAAWRAPVLGVRKLAESMNERLRLLLDRRPGVPQRQQTLRGALLWSYGLLDEAQQTVFRRMAVVADSLALDVLQDILADPQPGGALDPWAVLEALSTLVERSLVDAVPGHDGQMRYRLLESPKALARELLAERGETAACRRSHADCLERLAITWCMDVVLRNIGIAHFLRHLRPDARDLEAARAAVDEWGETSARPGLSLIPLYLFPSKSSFDAAWRVAHAHAVGGQDPLMRFLAAMSCAVAYARSFVISDDPVAFNQLLLAASEATPRDESYGHRRFAALYVASILLRDNLHADDIRLIGLLQEHVTGLRMFEDPAWSPELRACRLRISSALALLRGDHAEALTLAQAAAALCPTSWTDAHAVGTLAVMAGDLALAERVFRAELQRSSIQSYWPMEGNVRINLAATLLFAQRFREATSELQWILNWLGGDSASDSGQRPVNQQTRRALAWTMDHLALATAESGAWNEAAEIVAYSESLYADFSMHRIGLVERSFKRAREILAANPHTADSSARVLGPQVASLEDIRSRALAICNSLQFPAQAKTASNVRRLREA